MWGPHISDPHFSVVLFSSPGVGGGRRSGCEGKRREARLLGRASASAAAAASGGGRRDEAAGEEERRRADARGGGVGGRGGRPHWREKGERSSPASTGEGETSPAVLAALDLDLLSGGSSGRRADPPRAGRRTHLVQEPQRWRVRRRRPRDPQPTTASSPSCSTPQAFSILPMNEFVHIHVCLLAD
jgi:hypothetical protein